MHQNKHQILVAAVARLLKPLVRVLLRNGVSYGTFADIAKRQFVEVARNEFSIQGRKQSLSRVSVITGLTRKEVARVSGLHLYTMNRSEPAINVVKWLNLKR